MIRGISVTANLVAGLLIVLLMMTNIYTSKASELPAVWIDHVAESHATKYAHTLTTAAGQKFIRIHDLITETFKGMGRDNKKENLPRIAMLHFEKVSNGVRTLLTECQQRIENNVLHTTAQHQAHRVELYHDVRRLIAALDQVSSFARFATKDFARLTFETARNTLLNQGIVNLQMITISIAEVRQGLGYANELLYPERQAWYKRLVTAHTDWMDQESSDSENDINDVSNWVETSKYGKQYGVSPKLDTDQAL
jgi:hypothetical protein